MLSVYQEEDKPETQKLLIDSRALFEDDTQAALLETLALLQNKACSESSFDWSVICNKLYSIGISQHPSQIQEAEIQLEKIIKKNYPDTPANNEAFQTIANNLFLLSATNLLMSNHKLLHNVEVLNSIITKFRILNSKKYLVSKFLLTEFKKKYKSSTLDEIFKYAIGFNAGLNTGSTFYSVMTAWFLTLPVIIVSGVFSLALCFLIAHYFFNSYKDEDKDILREFRECERAINSNAYKQSLLRVKCYKLIMQKIALLEQCDPNDVAMIKDKKKLSSLKGNLTNNNCIEEFDKFINDKLNVYPHEASFYANNKIHNTNPNSIYTRVFHSKYWGPILNFFGAAGTSFGVVKTILSLAGVTTLLGSPLALLGVLTAATVMVGAVFAFKHLNFTLKTAEKKAYLKKITTEQINPLKAKLTQLRKFKLGLATDITYMQNIIQQNGPRPRVAEEDKPNNAVILISQHGIFKETGKTAEINPPVIENPKTLSSGK